MKTPKTLGKAGRALWLWLDEKFDPEPCAPMVTQLCELQDRLATVRADLAKRDLTTSDRDKLIICELRLIGGFTRCWRALGLANDAKPPAEYLGRPPESERRRCRS